MYTITFKNSHLNKMTTIRNLSKANLSDWTAYLDYKKITYTIK